MDLSVAVAGSAGFFADVAFAATGRALHARRSTAVAATSFSGAVAVNTLSHGSSSVAQRGLRVVDDFSGFAAARVDGAELFVEVVDCFLSIFDRFL